MKLNIKNIVHKELISESNKRSHLSESYGKIVEYKDEEFVRQLVGTTVSLINEGFTLDEITNFLNEEDNPTTDNVKGLGLGNIGLGSVIGGGFKSMIKEYIINWILKGALGFSAEKARSVSIVFADLPLKNLLKPFKDLQNCNGYLPAIIDPVLELLVRDFAGNLTNVEKTGYGLPNMPSNYLGNMFGKAIKDSNVSEQISSMICPLIHGGSNQKILPVEPANQNKPQAQSTPKSV